MASNDTQKSRPPIVVVMGHVDHGKTTLLDYLRETRVAEREAGGITQAVGAYEVVRNDKKITFIDTPGHAAFTQMRQRGATVADVAVLVVAADDGVKPQTQEAITILKETGIPYIVAINKIDKNNADIERTKQDLLAHGVELEGLGGDIPWIGVSAKEGERVDELLDLVLLLAEMQTLTYDPSIAAKGFVLEAHKDSRRGIVATLILKDGTIHKGDDISTHSADGSVRNLENFIGEQIDELQPSSPAVVVGFESLPLIGELFTAGELEMIEKQDLHPVEAEPQDEIVATEEREELPLILRADTSGSLEALAYVIKELSFDDVVINILSQEVGDITDGAIKDATASKAWVIGFNVKSNKAAENLAKSQHVKITTSDIIYRIVEAIEEFIAERDKMPEGGELEVLALFSQQGEKQVIGGQVLKGFIQEKDKFEIVREDEVIGRGRILNVQQGKENVKRAEEGECGLQLRSPEIIEKGDKIKVVVE